jgi:hypothetical protein
MYFSRAIRQQRLLIGDGEEGNDGVDVDRPF